MERTKFRLGGFLLLQLTSCAFQKEIVCLNCLSFGSWLMVGLMDRLGRLILNDIVIRFLLVVVPHHRRFHYMRIGCEVPTKRSASAEVEIQAVSFEGYRVIDRLKLSMSEGALIITIMTD